MGKPKKDPYLSMYPKAEPKIMEFEDALKYLESMAEAGAYHTPVFDPDKEMHYKQVKRAVEIIKRHYKWATQK